MVEVEFGDFNDEPLREPDDQDQHRPEVKDLRSEALALNECVADLTLENRLLDKSMTKRWEAEE